MRHTTDVWDMENDSGSHAVEPEVMTAMMEMFADVLQQVMIQCIEILRQVYQFHLAVDAPAFGEFFPLPGKFRTFTL